MNFDEVGKIMSEAGINICPVCGTPFHRYHRRQRTCGSLECQREWKKEYLKDWRHKHIEDDPDGFREYRRKAMRKYRGKIHYAEKLEEELAKAQEKWVKAEEFDKYVAEHGHEYGKKSAEKVLASVPKIDVNLGGKKNDDVHDQDES